MGLCCCAGLSLVVESKGCPLGAVSGLLILVASLVVSTGSRARGVQQLQPPGPGPAPVNWAQAQESWCPRLVALNVWGLPRSGIEPVSPALAGGFFTAEPPGKPYHFFIHSPVNGCLRGFRILAVVNSAAVNIELRASF